MHGLKIVILEIFQKAANWLDWPCPVSAARPECSPPKPPTGYFFLFYIFIFIYFFNYETIVRSGAWSFDHSDPDPSTVL